MRKFWIVAGQTYLRQVKSWSFVMLVLMPFIFAGVGFGIGYIGANSGSDHDKIAVISSEDSLREQYIRQNKDDVNKVYTSETAASKALKGDKIAGYLVLSTSATKIKAEYYGNDDISGDMKSHVNLYLNQVQQGLNVKNSQMTGTQLATLQNKYSFDQHIKKDTGKSNTAKQISFWILVVMVYMILISYSTITAQEIASEKGTKIMEIIFSSTSAVKYFIGKITGVMLVILTQILVYIIGGKLGLMYAQQASATKDFMHQYGSLVNDIVHNLLNVNLLFLLLGVVMYTILAALSGALVSKAEDASKAAQPSIMLSILAFFATFPFQNNVDAVFVKVCSYVPFLSSYFMPMRIINNNASPVEVMISLVILIATIILSSYYIGKMYKGLMLQTDSGGFISSLKAGIRYK
ncbi:ABC transporter permease [Companilactobacillus ginsenosidimutans]|uniref:ABC transporter permease n=1 Tax=Companilactobacillus ginsenosidimutans TaxID=1007676 RepID=A0A0H4QKR7_9LACO|nr:ABC transporter permease [Companilactobacillus ginsenosidimutans]AKP67691.1 ABC transporter permease [Companilactobacillus ginsenosidimutans]